MRVDQSQEDSSVGPNISTKRDLASLCEVEDSVTGAIIRSTFAYVDDQGVAWFGQAHGIRKYDIDVGDLIRLLKRVPDEEVYPLKSASTAIETKLLPRMLLEEAEVLQYLTQHHHQNLIRFHGCVVNRGRITGIALDKYKVFLRYRFEDVPHDLDINACMEGIRAGVKHLHSHGLAHNDLNPMNIALDSDDNPIIFDLGSCKRFGEELLSGGTPGWVDEDYTISAQRNDELAMDKIEAWLVAEKGQRIRA
ncbi:hypothetical protein P154DRAFT_492281 [Amniculicola lignicola CBS 123094]|uniref:Protein kinase domain-containing protein n=1 Tax=Amniculicola lignicola CBS 123094 TaxID=1392246 RepID=A0A6A5WF32_9PLEO|nr:hypothetical protein P154DRAFT_492281 [Amniculicola lignicola CBS 123094]